MSVSFPDIPPTDVVADERDGCAYVRLEEARLRVERLLAGGERQPTLDAAHRELGLAGFECSQHMDPAVRRQRLALARERVSLPVDDELAATINAIIAASWAVEEALVDSLADHVVSAHLNTLSACKWLDRFLDVKIYEQAAG